MDMFAISTLIYWSRSNSNEYRALSLSGPVRYSPRRVRLVGANNFLLVIFHPFEFNLSQKAAVLMSYHLLFRLHLHEFQLLSLLNGNPSHYDPRKIGERRAKSSLSELLSNCSRLMFHMVPYTQANILMVSIIS